MSVYAVLLCTLRQQEVTGVLGDWEGRGRGSARPRRPPDTAQVTLLAVIAAMSWSPLPVGPPPRLLLGLEQEVEAL